MSEKVIRRLMKEENLIVKIKRTRKYNSYKGEITPAVENIVGRDFHADKPNEKWLSDLTEFSIPAGKICLSPIVDCFDGFIPRGLQERVRMRLWLTKFAKIELQKKKFVRSVIQILLAALKLLTLRDFFVQSMRKWASSAER